MRCRYEPHTARHQDRGASPLTAAQEVPDNRRDGMVKAALVSIREKLKDARNVKVTKQKMKSKGAKVLARRKSVGRPEGYADALPLAAPRRSQICCGLHMMTLGVSRKLGHA